MIKCTMMEGLFIQPWRVMALSLSLFLSLSFNFFFLSLYPFLSFSLFFVHSLFLSFFLSNQHLTITYASKPFHFSLPWAFVIQLLPIIFCMSSYHLKGLFCFIFLLQNNSLVLQAHFVASILLLKYHFYLLSTPFVGFCTLTVMPKISIYVVLL